MYCHFRRAVAALAVVAACKEATSEPPPVQPDEPAPALTPAAPVMSRLTATQYRNTLRDILGEDVVLPQAPEPDEAAGGFIAVGASRTSVSPLGVERFEEAAYNLAAQVMDDPARRERLVPCSP